MTKKVTSVHHSRTLMFKELSDVMAQAQGSGSYMEVLENNATGKRTKSNQEKTDRYLRQLYGFAPASPSFKAFAYFWNLATQPERPLLALLFAIQYDTILTESIELIEKTNMGERAIIDSFVALIEQKHPERYSSNTRRSMAQNIASSWKQTGYLLGKIKNVRVETKPSYLVTAFALLMSYLNGDRGQYIMESRWVKALCIPQQEVKTLAFEAAKRDLVKIQAAGAVLTISFEALFKQIGIHEIED